MIPIQQQVLSPHAGLAESQDSINKMLELRLIECDSAILQRIDDLDAKLNEILDKLSTQQTITTEQPKRSLIDRILRRDRATSQ
jgi:hypothetical protein